MFVPCFTSKEAKAARAFLRPAQARRYAPDNLRAAGLRVSRLKVHHLSILDAPREIAAGVNRPKASWPNRSNLGPASPALRNPRAQRIRALPSTQKQDAGGDSLKRFNVMYTADAAK